MKKVLSIGLLLLVAACAQSNESAVSFNEVGVGQVFSSMLGDASYRKVDETSAKRIQDRSGHIDEVTPFDKDELVYANMGNTYK